MSRHAHYHHGRLCCGRHGRRIQPRTVMPLMVCYGRWNCRQQFRRTVVCGWSGERLCSLARVLSLGCYPPRSRPHKWRNLLHAGITLARQSRTNKVFPKWTGSPATRSEHSSASLCNLGFIIRGCAGHSVQRLVYPVVYESLFYAPIQCVQC